MAALINSSVAPFCRSTCSCESTHLPQAFNCADSEAPQLEVHVLHRVASQCIHAETAPAALRTSRSLVR